MKISKKKQTILDNILSYFEEKEDKNLFNSKSIYVVYERGKDKKVRTKTETSIEKITLDSEDIFGSLDNAKVILKQNIFEIFKFQNPEIEGYFFSDNNGDLITIYDEKLPLFNDLKRELLNWNKKIINAKDCIELLEIVDEWYKNYDIDLAAFPHEDGCLLIEEFEKSYVPVAMFCERKEATLYSKKLVRKNIDFIIKKVSKKDYEFIMQKIISL